MPTYSNNLAIVLIGSGDESGNWGNVTNDNFENGLDEAITATATVAFSGSDVPLDLPDQNPAISKPARHMRLNLTGTTGGSPRYLSLPNKQKLFVVYNDTDGDITVKNTTGSGTSLVVPLGKTMFIYNDGTNVVDVVNYLSDLTLGAALPASSGGTGVISSGTAGNVLTSNGAAWISSAPTEAVPSGGIIMWSGSIASIPAGWYLCDGTNSTPDLRNKFIIGAYQDNGGVAVTTVTGSNTTTGGSKDSIVVAHTHTGTTATDGVHSHEVLPLLAGSINGPGSYLQGANNDNNYGTASTGSAGLHSHTFTTDSTGSSGTNANLPPYYALAYIMKA